MDESFLLPEHCKEIVKIVQTRGDVETRARLRVVCRAFHQMDPDFVTPQWARDALCENFFRPIPDQRATVLEILRAMDAPNLFPKPSRVAWNWQCREHAKSSDWRWHGCNCPRDTVLNMVWIARTQNFRSVERCVELNVFPSTPNVHYRYNAKTNQEESTVVGMKPIVYQFYHNTDHAVKVPVLDDAIRIIKPLVEILMGVCTNSIKPTDT
jgi:hypothetical protein